MFKTYQYPTYFLTTDQVPEDSNYLHVFDVTEVEAQLIEEGVAIEVVEEHLIINEE